MSMRNSAPVELRRLGLYEKNETYTHYLGFYSAVCCAVKYHSPCASVTLSHSRIYAALYMLIKEQAVFSTSILNEESEEATFIRVSEIDIRRLVHIKQLSPGINRIDALNSALEERLSTRFAFRSQLPLWRLLLLAPDVSDPDQDVDVIFFIHHGVADGVSAISFHNELRKALNELNNLDDSSLPVPDPIIIPPILEYLPSEEELRAMLVSDSVSAHTQLPSSAPEGLWAGGPFKYPAGECVRTRHTIRVIEATTFASLLAACKAHEMTLQPLLEALFARAIFNALGESGVGTNSAATLTGGCPINTRPYLRADLSRSLGVFVTSDTHEFKNGDDIWTSAARAKAVLTDTLKKLAAHVDIGIPRFAGDIRYHYKDKIGKPRDLTFEASNAGALDTGIDGDWLFRRALFTQSTESMGPAFNFSACSIKGGPFCIGASWDDGVVEEGLVKNVLAHFSELVRDVSSGRL